MDGTIEITVTTTSGKTQTMVISEYNAFRIFGTLAVMLEIPISKAVGKAIILTGEDP
jgi:hypothetical protein